ncbi:PREDICTED: transforming acidic coiled-coil-containing protein 2-like, partial [Apaloderma vittatum]|uniref:transforming acidic coiled-coil-containing protein 2-like n=1 Tax=Apaloderma vittatum TaxID=57397 RepID=UPI00052174C3
MVAASIGNEGISSYSAEGFSNANPSVVSSEVTGQNTVLQEQGGQTDSNLLEQAAEARERSLPSSTPFADCAKEHVTADLTSSDNDKLPTSGCNEAVPSPGPAPDKEEGIAHDGTADGKRNNIAVTSVKSRENDPGHPSLEPSPPAAITETRGVEQMSLGELGLLWRSEQLGGMREPHVSTFPQGKEAGDYFTTQEARQEQGVLEVGQLQPVMQQGRQNTDGGEGLLMKKEALILNYPATGVSDSEKFGATVNAQVLAEMSEVSNLQMGAVTTAKGDEANLSLSGSKREQSEACTLMSELASNPPNLFLVPKLEEPLREYVLGNDSQDSMRSETLKAASEKTEPVFQRELQKEDELVSAKHFSMPLSFKKREEQKSAVTTKSPKDEASSDEIIKADDVSRESTPLSEMESIINPTKENSLADKRLLLEEYALSTSLSRSTELNQKETEADITQEGNKIGTEEAQVTETRELAEGSNRAEKQLLNSVSSHHQDTENTHLGLHPEEFSLCDNTSPGDLGEEAVGKPPNLDSNFKLPQDNSRSLGYKPEQMNKEKTAAKDDPENKLLASSQFPREECPLSFDCFNTEAEDKTSGQPGCNGTKKVCLAGTHSSSLLYSENNNIKQSKQDESWEKAFAGETVLESECKTESQEKPESCSKLEESGEMSKSKLELQGLKELAGTVDRMAVQTEEASRVLETKEQVSHVTEMSHSDPEQGPAAAQSSVPDSEEEEGIQHEKHQTTVKSFADDKDLALKSEWQSDVLMQAQLEPAAAESHRDVQMACSETPQAVAGTSGLTPQKVHMEEGDDSPVSENSCPSENDTGSSLETPECSIRGLQEHADVPTALPQAEQTEKSVPAGDSGRISDTGQEQEKQQSSLTTVARAGDEEHKERALKPEHSLDANNHSNRPEMPPNTSNNLNKDSPVLGTAPIQCNSDTAEEKDVDKSSTLVSEDSCSSKHGQNISGVTGLNLQDCNEQNKTDLKAEENCRSKQNSNKPEQDNNSLISASQHEAACHSDTFSKESDKNEQPGSTCRIKDNTGESCAAAINALPGMQNTASATNISQALPSDTEIAHASDNSEKNDPRISRPETQGKMPLMAKKLEKNEGLTGDGEIIQKDGNTEISCEDSASVAEMSNVKSDKRAEARVSPSPLRAHGEVIPTDKSYESSCIQKTPDEPGYCRADFTASSASTAALRHPSQQPGNNTNNGTGGELLNNELEVVACQKALEGNSNLQIAAGSQVSVRLGPSPRVSTDKKSESSENSSAGNVYVSEKDVPDQSFQGDGERSLVLPETLDVGQSAENLSQLSSEKLKKEISAIKAKETRSEVNFKEQRSDSSAESLLAIPALEGKLLSLSSVGKQEGCNEEIAANICVDDKCGKILEKPGNSEKMEELSKENNNITRAESSISEQSAENSGREHEALTCSSLDISSSLPDFREHISQIFKKTVRSTLSAELPPLLPENHAAFKQSPVAKDTAEPCGSENFPESNKADKAAPQGTSEAEERELSLATEASCKAPKNKTLQQGIAVAEPPPASLQDTGENRQPGSSLDMVPRLDGATPAERGVENLQKPDGTTAHPESGEMERKEGVCASGVDPELLISLEIKKQGPASFDGAAAENFPAHPDTVAVISTGDVQKSDLEDAATAEGNNLITECNAEPVSSEEDVSLPTEQCQDLKPNEQEKSKCGDPDVAKSISDMAASALVPGGSYNHEKLPGNFNVSPGENQETHICSNFMHDIKAQDDMQMIQDDPVNRQRLETLENSQDAQQEKKVTVHGLIEYLKNEVSQDDCLQADSQPDSSNMTEGDGKESSDTVLSTAKTGNKKNEDIPETGTARMLVTGEGDLATNMSTEEQETDLYKNHSPSVPAMEQGERSASTELTLTENQPSKRNSEHESSLQDAKRKLSPLALAEPKNLDLNEIQDVAVGGLPTE